MLSGWRTEIVATDLSQACWKIKAGSSASSSQRGCRSSLLGKAFHAERELWTQPDIRGMVSIAS